MPLNAATRPAYPWAGTAPGEQTYAQKLAEWQASQLPAGGTGGGATTPAGGTLLGAPAFSYAGAYGGIPQVPSPQATQGAALGGNLANLPMAEKLATETNTFNNAQAVAPFTANLPGYAGMLGQASQNAGNLLQGVLPPDVERNITQAAAERGIAIGSPGSPNADAGLLRGLGLTTLDLQNRGQSQFTQLMGITPTGPQLNPASMFVSPEQQQQAQMAANVYSAAPVPALKAQADLAAMLAGLGRGQGSQGGGGGYGRPSTEQMAPVYPGMAPNPTAPGKGTGSLVPSYGSSPFEQQYDSADPLFGPGANYSSMISALGDPNNFGGYNVGNSGAEVPPEIAQWAAALDGGGGAPGFESIYDPAAEDDYTNWLGD